MIDRMKLGLISEKYRLIKRDPIRNPVFIQFFLAKIVFKYVLGPFKNAKPIKVERMARVNSNTNLLGLVIDIGNMNIPNVRKIPPSPIAINA